MSRTERTVYGACHMADFSAVRPGPLALVNREHPLPGGFTVTLAPPVEAAPDILLEAQAARMLAACLAAIGAGGRIVPVSGWRSHAEQKQIWDDTLAKEGEAFTRAYVAWPGCSEHESGLAIDLAEAAEEIDFIRPAFPYDGICGAFRRAAAQYGFIERYRADKTALTGIAAEPWHFRYVGGLCLEEYIALLAEGPLTCTLSNGRRATVRRVAAGAALPPAAGLRQLSGDNAGGLILTDWEAIA